MKLIRKNFCKSLAVLIVFSFCIGVVFGIFDFPIWLGIICSGISGSLVMTWSMCRWDMFYFE